MLEIPLLLPVMRSVSSSISLRTISKSVKMRPLQCKNSAYSAQARVAVCLAENSNYTNVFETNII